MKHTITIIVLLLAGTAWGQSGPDDYVKLKPFAFRDTSYPLIIRRYYLFGKPYAKIIMLDSTWVDSTYVINGNDTIPIKQWIKHSQ